EARWVLERLPELGISIDNVTQQLEDEGVEKFNKPFDKLMETLPNVGVELKGKTGNRVDCMLADKAAGGAAPPREASPAPAGVKPE
ncbi:MAG: hypothetical protein NT045_09140, partial [Candidatus Aureabacteria bacterium]|nr:hypothetical protein [Candidatus Auribacterota bacterium]